MTYRTMGPSELCPDNAIINTLDECTSAARYVDKSYPSLTYNDTVYVGSYAHLRKGCVVLGKGVFWNTHATGTYTGRSSSVCREIGKFQNKYYDIIRNNTDYELISAR